MESTAGLNDATTFDIVMGVLYGITAVILIATAYIIYTKQFRRKKMEVTETVKFVTARYGVYTEKVQLLIDAPHEMTVKLELLDINENQLTKLLDKTLNLGEHIIVFDPNDYDPGEYYFKLVAETTSILKKIKINRS